MDWNALGTWAAVVVALGISLKDTFHRWRQRSARHLLVAATIYPEVGSTIQAFKLLLEETEHVSDQGSVIDLRGSCDRFLSAIHNLGLLGLTGHADQVDALPEHILVPLVKAMTVMRMLAHNGGIEQMRNWGDDIDEVGQALDHWRNQFKSVLVSLEWVERGIQRRLRSRRWTNPEMLEW